MQLKSIGIEIARRELDANGARVSVAIGKPEKFPDADDYFCPYQVTGIGNGKVRYAGGVDAVQALLLALKMIGADLYTSKEAQAKQLSWSAGENGNLGFPVPDSLQDLVPDRRP